MTDELKQTVKILRHSKVSTDGDGRSVWADTIETAKLELVSTQRLKKLIAADDDATKNKLRKAAEGEEGLLTLDTDSQNFEIVSDEELRRILDSAEKQSTSKKTADVIYEPVSQTGGEAEELELVSTQMLRRILKTDEEEPEQVDEEEDTGSAFDPYNSA